MIATDHNLSLVDSAPFFAQVYVTIIDAQITTWNSKYFYNFWRPVTAIRNADIANDRAIASAEHSLVRCLCEKGTK